MCRHSEQVSFGSTYKGDPNQRKRARERLAMKSICQQWPFPSALAPSRDIIVQNLIKGLIDWPHADCISPTTSVIVRRLLQLKPISI